MADITVRFFNNLDEGLFKVTWSMGSKEVFYHTSISRIEACSKKIRSALQELVDAGRDKEYAKYDHLVRKLAQEGYKLFEALLFGDQATDKTEAARARHWIRDFFVPNQDVITFRLPTKTHFPWGLIYDEPVDDATDPEQLKNHFWCVKFSATVHYFVNRFEWFESAWPKQSFGLLFGADQELWTTTSQALQPAEKDRLDKLLGHPPEPSFKIDDIERQWREQGDALKGLLTLYCHASGSELSIGGRTLTADDFEEIFERQIFQDASPPALVFLAGCKTGVGDLHQGFFRATAKPGYCGFIGTEVKVPDIFTLRFATHFLDRFFATGETVGRIMLALRLQHWPLSLVFSVCCPLDLRLEPTQEGMVVAPLNLSIENVSSG
jgi:CHAT domain